MNSVVGEAALFSDGGVLQDRLWRRAGNAKPLERIAPHLSAELLQR
jgi:hypothetical protein